MTESVRFSLSFRVHGHTNQIKLNTRINSCPTYFENFLNYSNYMYQLEMSFFCFFFDKSILFLLHKNKY